MYAQCRAAIEIKGADARRDHGGAVDRMDVREY
jgi:hypothetical protein